MSKLATSSTPHLSSPTPAATMPANTLQPLRFPLCGSQLIEASAGTGKTWTIAALYLRLILGHGAPGLAFARPLRPDEILVMTFTRAATRELSARIRTRLLEAAQAFRASEDAAEPDADAGADAGAKTGPSPSAKPDPFLAELLADYPEPAARQHAAWQLALAAEGMDEAAVHTIDAWCQRMLREHAFDSGSLFDEELLADEGLLLTQAAHDYWRQQIYPLAAESLAELQAIWPGVQALVEDAQALASQPLPPDAGQGSLGELLSALSEQRAAAIAQLKQGWAEKAAWMDEWLCQQLKDKTAGWDGRKLASRHFQSWLASLAEWAEDEAAQEPPDLKTGRTRLTPAGLLEARKAGAAPITLPPVFAEFEALWAQLEQVPAIAPAVRLHAAARVAQRVAQLKRQTGHFGFADLQARLEAALAGPHGERLRQRIVAQTPVALIDEFQDTSALQYRLFDRLYRVDGRVAGEAALAHTGAEPSAMPTALLMIGDPKQSIYRFRGADIASYLAARRATAGHHHVLGTNHRSSAALVRAVNHCFSRAEARGGAGAFGYAEPLQQGIEAGIALATEPARTGAPAENPLPFLPVQAQGRKERFVCGEAEEVPALTLVHDLTLANGETHRAQFAERCAEQIVAWLNQPHAGFESLTAERGFERLRPADIAVLVRNGREAQAVRSALRRRGVASVYLSDRDSVFASAEAVDLLHWLRAVAQPLDTRLSRVALATGMLGLSLAELAWLAADDEAFDARTAQLKALQAVWQGQGVLAMLRQTLHLFDLPARWLVDAKATEAGAAAPSPADGGERSLTNFLHLAELLQAASHELEGEPALIRWLAEQCEAATSGSGAGGDEQIVRLESDAGLVQVVTVHKSKGLEYPLVFLPFASHFRAESRSGTRFVVRPDGEGQPHLDLGLSEESLRWAEQERLREDLRLLYVALTRARHALWVGFGALKVGREAACQNHRSALGCLIGGPESRDAAQWADALVALADECTDICLQDAASAEPAQAEAAGKAADSAWPLLRLAPRHAPPPLAEPAHYDAAFDKRWGIASFSALVRAAGQPGALAMLAAPRPADDEQAAMGWAQEAANAAPSVEASQPQAPAETPVWHRFERGALAGNFLHDQLEWLAGERFALAREPALALRLAQRCERAGRGAQAAVVLQWLSVLLEAPLPALACSLATLAAQGAVPSLPEMEFWLPAQRLPAAEIDGLCRAHWLAGLERPALPERELHGMLMGFADLVFEHEGRYWVLDYKSNHLGPDGSAYTAAALAQAMAEHRYEVQAALYLLALHRLLRSRLGAAYAPELHLGGAIFLFLRGIDGPEAGCLTLSPPMPLLEVLDALLSAEPVC